MKLIVEVPGEMYDFCGSEPDVMLVGAIESVEVRQEGSLLRRDMRCSYAERLSYEVAHQLGLPDGRPAIKLYLQGGENVSNP